MAAFIEIQIIIIEETQFFGELLELVYYRLSNRRYALISVTPDKIPKINKRYAIKNSLISVTQDIFYFLCKKLKSHNIYVTDVTKKCNKKNMNR